MPVGIVVLGIIIFYKQFNTGNMDMEHFVLLIILLLYYFLVGIRLKKAALGENGLIISNYWKSVNVPFGKIKKIKEHKVIAPSIISIEFSVDTDFGRKVIFLSEFAFTFSFFSPHPILKELADLKALASDV